MIDKGGTLVCIRTYIITKTGHNSIVAADRNTTTKIVPCGTTCFGNLLLKLPTGTIEMEKTNGTLVHVSPNIVKRCRYNRKIARDTNSIPQVIICCTCCITYGLVSTDTIHTTVAPASCSLASSYCLLLPAT